MSLQVTYFAEGFLGNFDKTRARKFSTESGSLSVGGRGVDSTDTPGVRGGCDGLLVGSCLTMLGLSASEFSLLLFVGRSSLLLSMSSFYCRSYEAVRYGADERRQRESGPFLEPPSWTKGLS